MSEFVQSVNFADSKDAKSIGIEVRLAVNIPACCGVADGAYMEFHQKGQYARAELALREDRGGNILEGTVSLPTPGIYGYRLVAKILGKPIYLEGTYSGKNL